MDKQKCTYYSVSFKSKKKIDKLKISTYKHIYSEQKKHIKYKLTYICR